LVSGNHGAVAGWRRRQSLLRTLIRRPELLERVRWSRPERRLMEELARDLEAMEFYEEIPEGREFLENADRMKRS
ncbi:MAG: hypothetical protein HQL86_09165, partial [Magnetococcales bacterium]|nr:hypothetical protein [Magnetococcales bacterium]